MMKKLTLVLLEEIFTIHRFPPDAGLPGDIAGSQFYWVGKTDEELSLVCSSEIMLDSEEKSEGWSGFKVAGPLDFSQVGILAEISGVLASANISIFALSTFDTDYILVKTEGVEKAVRVLADFGYSIKVPGKHTPFAG